MAVVEPWASCSQQNNEYTMEKKQITKGILATLFFFFVTGVCGAVSVRINVPGGMKSPAAKNLAERNLAEVLTEVNRAQAAGVNISNRSFKMTDAAKKSMERIYVVSPFFCPESEVSVNCWVFPKYFSVRNIPIILQHKGESFGDEESVYATADFDNSGNIIDFRIQLSFHVATRYEEFEGGNEVEDLTQKDIILQSLEHFRTAYNEKNIAAIEEMFSDDALIITGRVVQRVTQGDRKVMSQKVVYNRQTKQQYITNLKRAFIRNKFIRVDFSGTKIKRSLKDPTMIGIKLHQSWKSSNYSDEGCLFLIWQFREGREPIIHVRTWSPVDDDDMTTLAGFDL